MASRSLHQTTAAIESRGQGGTQHVVPCPLPPPSFLLLLFNFVQAGAAEGWWSAGAKNEYMMYVCGKCSPTESWWAEWRDGGVGAWSSEWSQRALSRFRVNWSSGHSSSSSIACASLIGTSLPSPLVSLPRLPPSVAHRLTPPSLRRRRRRLPPSRRRSLDTLAATTTTAT